MHGFKAAPPCFRIAPCLPVPYQHASPRVRCRSAPGPLQQVALPPSCHQPLVQTTPEGGIEVLLPWPLPARQRLSPATSSAGGGEEQGEKMAIIFSAMGSGLLWARSTGLKVRSCMHAGSAVPVPVIAT